MPNTSHAHSLSLSLSARLFWGKVELQHIVVFNLYKQQLFVISGGEKKKKKKAKQALRNLLLHSLHLVSQGRISNLDLRQKAGRWVVGAHLPP